MAFLVLLLIVAVIIGGGFLLSYSCELDMKKTIERDFASNIENSFDHVKRYCTKFKASIDHLDTILKMFEELTTTGSLKYLKQYDGYLIPTTKFHFTDKFYILVDDQLRYRLIIVPDYISIRDDYNDITPEESAKEVKRYLPYSKTFDEFKAFVEECHTISQEMERERERRRHVGDVIKRNIK